MQIPLRCSHDLYGIFDEEALTIEVKCKRRQCGAQPGVVVLHMISLREGQVGKVVSTKRFADPRRKVGKNNVS